MGVSKVTIKIVYLFIGFIDLEEFRSFKVFLSAAIFRGQLIFVFRSWIWFSLPFAGVFMLLHFLDFLARHSGLIFIVRVVYFFLACNWHNTVIRHSFIGFVVDDVVFLEIFGDLTGKCVSNDCITCPRQSNCHMGDCAAMCGTLTNYGRCFEH